LFDPQEIKKPISEVITTIEIPTLSTIPPGGLILEDFEDNWMTNPSATTTDSEELGDQSSSDNVTLNSTPESEATQSFNMIPIWPTPRATGSPQTSSHAASPDLPVVDLFAPRPSQEIRGDVGESNIIEGLRNRKPSQR